MKTLKEIESRMNAIVDRMSVLGDYTQRACILVPLSTTASNNNHCISEDTLKGISDANAEDKALMIELHQLQRQRLILLKEENQHRGATP